MTRPGPKLLTGDPLTRDPETRFHLWSALRSDVRKSLYRCTSTLSNLNNCGGISFKSLSHLYEVVRTIFSSDFWTFRNFSCNFAKIVALPSDENENCVVHLKEQSLLKKAENLVEIGL